MNSPFEINETSEKRFYQGWINWCFRQYFYTQEGLNNVSQFRTIAYFLIGIGLIFKIDNSNYKLLAMIGLATLPILWVL